MPRPPTRPIPIPRVTSERPSAAPALHPAVPEIRPEFPAPHGDEEMTVMMPSKSAAALPPPPDPHAARIPRQWSPVGQVVSSHSSLAAQPTLPSLSIPPRSSVPTAPSSLAGIAFNDSTARVRTGALGKIARPTLSWAAALVALGIFVGIGSAVVSRNDVLRGKSTASAGETRAKNDKADKKSATAAKAAPASSTKLTSATPPPLVSPVSAGSAGASPPPPLPGIALTPPVGEIAANQPVSLSAGGPAAGSPLMGVAEATAARAVAADRPNLPNDPANANGGLMPSPGVRGQAPIAQAAPRPRPAAAPAPRAARAPVARAEEEAPAAPAPANAKAAAKKKEADLSKQAADLAAEQLGSLL